MQFKAFTAAGDGIMRKLECPVQISQAFDPREHSDPKSAFDRHEFRALWDTGATSSAIAPAVVEQLGLAPIGMVSVTHADGQTNAEVYLIGLWLPNEVTFCNIRVTKLSLAETDILIGMDVINQGDFAVTNVEGRTVFTYRVPSCQAIDYVDDAKATMKVSRNAPCPCGSGKKYKKCCGK